MKFLSSLLAVALMAQQQGVNLYSLEKERAMGEQYAAEIRRQSNPVADPAVDAYVKRIGAELVAKLSDVKFDYQFEAISDERTEPIPLPGGFIFVPVRALLAAQDEAEFAGMIAHAVAHVALRLDTRQASRGQIVNMASIPLVYMGGWHPSHQDSPRSGTLVPLSLLPFQRKNELEADRFGVELASRAGYDARASLRYIERTQPADSTMSPLPPREERLANLREVLSSLPSPAPSSSGGEFRLVQQAVRSMVEEPAEQRRVPTLKR